MRGVLSQIPGLGGYVEANQLGIHNQSEQLKQAAVIQGILSRQQAEEEGLALRGILSKSGGDPEKAMEGALASGHVGVAAKLAPIVKLAQEQRQQRETREGLQKIYGPIGQPPKEVPPAEVSAGAMPTQAPASPATSKEARIQQLKQMSLLYANNPTVMQRLQVEMDKLAQPDPAPKERKRISGDQEIQEEFDNKTQTWKEIGRGPRFAKSVAPINFGAADRPIGDFTKLGEEFLNTIPVADRQIVKKLATYEINPLSLSTKGGHREKMLALASQYNPEYDDTQYANKRRAIAQFGSGPQGNTVRSLNVAIEHLDTLGRAADALKNGNFTPANRVYNEVAKVFGVTPPNTFEGIRDIVANEVVKGTIGNAGALQDRAEAAAKVKAASSPAQLKELMNSWTELMGGQVKGLEQQYSGATGLKDFRSRYLTKRATDAIALSESKATGGVREFATEAEALASGVKGRVKIGGRNAVID